MFTEAGIWNSVQVSPTCNTGRSESKARVAIKEIKDATPDKTVIRKLDFLHLKLNNLASIKASVEYKSKETKLYIL